MKPIIIASLYSYYSLYLWLLSVLLSTAPSTIEAAAFLGRAQTTTNHPILITTTTTTSVLLFGTSSKKKNDDDKDSGGAKNNKTMKKTVLVTGANKGIGKAICQKLLQEYPDVVVLLGSRDARRGQTAVDDLQNAVGADICKDRLFCVAPLDTSSDASVQAAARLVQEDFQISLPLFGIVNNAGIMLRDDVVACNNVNYFGIRRVTNAFIGMLQRPGGRIVNIASASGPIFISNALSSSSGSSAKEKEVAKTLSLPWTLNGNGIDELDAMARDPEMIVSGCNAYGFSKALVSAYTWCLAKEHADLIINAVSPGYINTDMTRGGGATNPPSMGAIPPAWLLMDESLQDVPTGRYYGSDCKRSPLDVYRGPGDPVYKGPDGQ